MATGLEMGTLIENETSEHGLNKGSNKVQDHNSKKKASRAQKIGRTRENPSFCRSILLTVVVLLDDVCGVSGGVGGVGGRCDNTDDGGWWHWLVVFMVLLVSGVCGVCGGCRWCRDSEELPKQSQSGKSKAEERYENNIEGDGQGSLDGDEENESEKEKELESHVDTIADPMVELIKKKLAGPTAIRRVVRQGQPNVEALHDQPTKADPGSSSGGVVGVRGKHVDAATTMMMSMLMLKKK
ncbi:hypothetical protein FXO37_28912 [Capsicum annuum]|nr:hypothetical protein FXO37_28912 [Capsicum annuum]